MDVLLVSLGSTIGLRHADEALAASMRRAGADVGVAVARRPREVRTLALTDLVWARAARAAAQEALERARPRALLYSTTTAALLWPEPGAIRYDALAADNRPGRHGVWQRPLERRRLAQASLLVPCVADAAGAPSVPIPHAVDASGPPAKQRDIAALTYGINPQKKGLDRVLVAWAEAARPGEELVVAGINEPAGGAPPAVRFTGPLPADEYRTLVRRARTFVIAPRREDFGLVQLEALADGCALVTTPAPGPYAALPIARALDARLVVEPGRLATALRAALDAPVPGYADRAAELVAPFTSAAVDRIVAERLLPALLAGR